MTMPFKRVLVDTIERQTIIKLMPQSCEHCHPISGFEYSNPIFQILSLQFKFEVARSLSGNPLLKLMGMQQSQTSLLLQHFCDRDDPASLSL